MMRHVSGQPVYRLVVLSFVLIALIPLTFLVSHIYQAAWDDAWREVSEKHRLLAMNLASPIRIYINDHRSMLGKLADDVARQSGHPRNNDTLRGNLRIAFRHLDGFRSLSLVDDTGLVVVMAHRQANQTAEPGVFSDENCFIYTQRNRKWTISSVKPSPITGEPTLIMSQPVLDTNNNLLGVLLGELRIELIESLRAGIRFGVGGHSAIVDKTGHVIAHPNAEWMSEMRDLSHLGIVREMMAGKNGVTEFYSPFVKENMVAGYAAVPEIGWGVMVPQPKSEVQSRVNTLIYSHLSWAVFGLILAIVFSIPLALWITRPINRLAAQSTRLAHSRFKGELPEISEHAPREVAQLGAALRDLVGTFKQSQNEVSDLNKSLQARIDEATRQLREANAQLEVLARSDHLTQLPNRRHFETTLGAVLGRRESDDIDMCIMLIDVDNFKKVNDTHGHAAGDAVLTQVAALLEAAMRSSDLVARFGGDEFIARMHCDREVCEERAEQIRSVIEKNEFAWEGNTLHTTVSIGLLYCGAAEVSDVHSLISLVDQAMYHAKKRGRNTVESVAL
ncbi:MAG: diguanylate cyclase [Pseudomonadota bacterium]|nr:MAG: diguanylate cyclase [Pseudomonadota bacterium]